MYRDLVPPVSLVQMMCLPSGAQEGSSQWPPFLVMIFSVFEGLFGSQVARTYWLPRRFEYTSWLLLFDQSGLTRSERSLNRGADVRVEEFIMCNRGVLTLPDDETLEAT